MKKLITILLLSLSLNAFTQSQDSTIIVYEYYTIEEEKETDKTLVNVLKNVGSFAIGCLFIVAVSRSEFNL